jgi:hypothetical protein
LNDNNTTCMFKTPTTLFEVVLCNDSKLMEIFPYTLNSICIDMTTRNYIKDPEVNTIHEFDSLTIPTIITNY